MDSRPGEVILEPRNKVELEAVGSSGAAARRALSRLGTEEERRPHSSPFSLRERNVIPWGGQKRGKHLRDIRVSLLYFFPCLLPDVFLLYLS